MIRFHHRFLRRKIISLRRPEEAGVVRHFKLVLTGLLLLILTGMLGYHFIEGWSLFDALCMTIITLSTVGYTLINEMSVAGWTFTIFMNLFGIGLFTYFLARLVTFVVEGEIRNLFAKRRIKRMIERMKGHHIVCGCGRLGAEVVKELHRNHAPVVAIESDEKSIQQEIAPLNIPFIQGNATETGILQQAGVEKASTLVTCLPNDADNVYICLTARSTNRQLTIISRASQSNSEDLLRKAGADRVIFPYQLAGYRMALHCVRRAVTRFLDTISEDFRFDEVVIPQGSSISGKELKDSGIRQTANVIVVGVLGGDGVLRPNPTPDMVLNESDTLILLGSGDQLSRVRDMVAGTR